MKKPLSRIQSKNRKAILNAGLEVFSQHGFRGSTLEQIAQTTGMSKPNLLYYFPSKEAIHVALLTELMDIWLAPLIEMDPEGEPIDEILKYVRRKLKMSRDMPRESRLFANEVMQGAPRMEGELMGDLKKQFVEKSIVIQGWIDSGRIAKVHPHHLIFSIWALTQHYADFDAQVHFMIGADDPYPEAEAFLEQLFTKTLAP
ncbi:TetR family transcriptional regulator C-terminal domain-containing protein [Actibacterium pelagium]|uniref:TetR family transcriptional regulator n=1 Tax=Actibacterium pelagium TaxID=2029103 RepID=A0A917EJT3_9RHOB|nr:TetR family transcriptional regulator C-terminal domain-containing protein [Actibacterium pelagium]GGE45837.1 TetR family transcriptional regulator [Actibacterium pelagium]